MKIVKTRLPEIRLQFVRENDIPVAQITSSTEAYKYLHQLYDNGNIELIERFIILYLSRSNTTLGWQLLSQGGISGTVVDFRLMFATALMCGASTIVLSHNHPSGNKNPSEQDKKVTLKADKIGKLHDIRILDHIIITSSGYSSMKDEGII